MSQVKEASVPGREASRAGPGTGSPGRFSDLHWNGPGSDAATTRVTTMIIGISRAAATPEGCRQDTSADAISPSDYLPVSLRLSSRCSFLVVSLRSLSEMVSCTGGRPASTPPPLSLARDGVLHRHRSLRLQRALGCVEPALRLLRAPASCERRGARNCLGGPRHILALRSAAGSVGLRARHLPRARLDGRDRRRPRSPGGGPRRDTGD